MKTLTLFTLSILSACLLNAQVVLPAYQGTQYNTAPDCGLLTDDDGNAYHTVVIDTQCWMKENLHVTHYPDGTEIPLVTNTSGWTALSDTDISNVLL